MPSTGAEENWTSQYEKGVDLSPLGAKRNEVFEMLLSVKYALLNLNFYSSS